MRLKDVVVRGRFCGLETVEECLLNFELHMMQMFPYNALEYEIKELNKDIKAYEAGELQLNWKEIDEKVAQDLKAFEEYCNSHPPEILADSDEELDAMFDILR